MLSVALLLPMLTALAVGLVALGEDSARVVTLTLIAVPVAAGFAIQAARLLLRYTLAPLEMRAFSQPVEEAPALVVPVIIRREGDIEAIRSSAVANLPYAARHPMIFLIDLPDANSAKTACDGRLIARLKDRLSDHLSSGKVVLLTRRRRYDPVDQVWRGWERKRGKIEEFCRFLRGDKLTSYEQDLPPALVGSSAFVTIDIDTQLTAETISALMAAADREAAIVTPMLEDRCGSDAPCFARLVELASRREAFNPQLNFNQSRLGYDLYYGKGLINVDRFLQRTLGRIAERTILSHDHLEAVLAGAVASSDARIQEQIPDTRSQWARRQYRWTRGDFQIVPWILRSDLPLPSRLHLLEIVLNHLAPPACILLAAAALVLLPWSISIWIAFACILLLRPTIVLLPTSLPLVLFQRGVPIRRSVQCAWSIIASETAAWALRIIYAPGDSYLVVRAVLVVLWRRGWSGRNLLEWEDGAEPRHGSQAASRWLRAVTRASGIAAVIVAVGTGAGIQLVAMFAALWLLGPDALRFRLRRKRIRRTTARANRPQTDACCPLN